MLSQVKSKAGCVGKVAAQVKRERRSERCPCSARRARALELDPRFDFGGKVLELEFGLNLGQYLVCFVST